MKDEVKNETLDSTWKQMTSQAGNMLNRPRVDPYSKVVLNEGNLGLSGVGYNNQGQQNNLSMNVGYNISQPSPDSQGLANMNIASPLMDQNNLNTLGKEKHKMKYKK